jgi:hypothetical protein
MCGPVPAWLSNATLPYSGGSNLGTPCTSVACSAGVPLEWLAEVSPLLTLKDAAVAAATDSLAANTLDTWEPIVPPCTSDPAVTTCHMCTAGDISCGGIRTSDGAYTCNWRYVACRDRRAVAVDLSGRGLRISALPAGLANGTVLEQLDLTVRCPGCLVGGCEAALMC